MRNWTALLALGLIASACEDGAPERNVTRVKVANPHSDQLKGMSELYRNLGILRAIKDAGRRCKKVDAAAYQEDYKNLAMWVARCTDTGDFAVYIGPNAEAQVSPCKEAQTLGLPLCRPLPAAKPEKAAR